MEASALQAPATLPQTRVALGTPLLRFRSDEQLVALFRAGHEEAFRAIHERYHKRLFAYARQMLPGRQDAEDALQDVFVRAYAGLRASNQDLALRAWLFRVAHNRCIDELRRPCPPPPEVLQLVRSTVHDPLVEVDVRESLRRLIEDIRRLPEQQRSALLMRELAGVSYADVSASLGVSVGAVKSLLVRARVSLAEAADARDTSCVLIREQLVEAHDRGLRPNATARKHMRDCVGCKSFRRELRGISRQLAAVAPTVGPLGVLAKTLGFSGGGGGGLALLGGGGTSASAGGLAVGVNHAATLLVAAVATAGGAVELQHTIIAPTHHSAKPTAAMRQPGAASTAASAAAAPTAIQAIAHDVVATVSTAPKIAATADPPATGHVRDGMPKQMTSDAAFGGPVSGASGLPKTPSTTDTSKSTKSSGSAGTGTAGSSSCSTLISSGANVVGTATPQGSTSTSTQTPATTASAAATPAVPCVTTTAPSAGASSSSSTSATASSGQSGSPATASSSNSGSSGSASTGGGSASASSSGSPATGGSSTAK